MLKYKIPQIVTLTRSNLVINPLIERQGGNFLFIRLVGIQGINHYFKITIDFQ